ncbi:aminotransferase class V-fold PLP-dependent enzyme [Microbacterium betulae]|uniref:Aminotransferase class V-fold PLP-dependent enzyme n=1 Tax=Microbacterium betulae TaxID=2981139 RepID=A0AA97I873_9MICO|nr:aminotransferase class V-fold PLP-dependent enzyme [Microbacterium sp. AB]WOF24377.1 aminotransferase class V-fold PLP-dependent enzyme [Microbacterium sp. AB]
MTTLDDFTASFAVEPGYLDWAAFGPLSPVVRAEARADLELLGSGRESGIGLVAGRVREARSLLGRVFDVEPSEVVLQPTATHGLAQAIYGVVGGVVASAAEFPGIPVTVTRAAAALGRIVPQWIAPEHRFVTPEAVAETIDETTSAVAVSLVDFRTGYRADLAGIREAIGDDRLLIVDATQAVGVIAEDYSRADVVVGHAYKWLRAGRGTGFAWYGNRARIALDPVLSGITGADTDDLPFDVVPPPAPAARAFTVSRPDPLAAARLASALGEVVSVGVGEIERAVAERASRVIEIADAHGIDVLTPHDPERRAGIVALAPDAPNVGVLGAALANAGVAATTRSDLVRISAHAGTDDETLRMLDEACATFVQMRVR